MKKYNPHSTPDGPDWLAASEDERMLAVRAYHRRKHISLPSERMHAAIHAVVETQLALGEAVVVETFERLQREGLDRHDAIHAIGKVLAEHVYDVMDHKFDSGDDLNTSYAKAVACLTAKNWLDAD